MSAPASAPCSTRSWSASRSGSRSSCCRLGGLPLRSAEVAVGIGVVAIGSGLYLMTRLGAGPRDGLMLGLHRRTGLSVRLVRTVIESSATAGGFALGGQVGIGTLAFALLIGPSVQAALGALSSTPAHEL